MAIELAYRCPRTNTFFALSDKAAYVAHLKTLARKSLTQKYNAKQCRAYRDVFAELRQTARSLDDVAQWLTTHAAFLSEVGSYAQRRNGSTPNQPLEARLENVQFEKVRFESRHPNTHEAPVHGARRPMWPDDKSLPQGYPALCAHMTFFQSKDVEVADALRLLGGLYTGGGGTYGHPPCNYHYYVTFFAEDWSFIGAAFLHSYIAGAAHPSVTEQDAQRIVKYAFPGLTWENFNTFAQSGILSGTKEELQDWLSQYVTPVLATYAETTLPVELEC